MLTADRRYKTEAMGYSCSAFSLCFNFPLSILIKRSLRCIVLTMHSPFSALKKRRRRRRRKEHNKKQQQPYRLSGDHLHCVKHRYHRQLYHNSTQLVSSAFGHPTFATRGPLRVARHYLSGNRLFSAGPITIMTVYCQLPGHYRRGLGEPGKRHFTYFITSAIPPQTRRQRHVLISLTCRCEMIVRDR